MTPTLIGLVGRSRVGKDTLASFFADTHEVAKLARPIKDACKALYGWTDAEVEGPLKDTFDLRQGVTPRNAMVHLTESIKTFRGRDFFTRRFFDFWDERPVVITDVRYPEDIKEIHARGGTTIKITRSAAPRYEFENEIDSLETTWEISNDGTLEDLMNKMGAMGLK